MVEQRRLDEALLYVEASLDRRVDPEALSLKGSVLLAKGNRTAAIPVLEEAIRLDPTMVFAEYNLAGAYALSGRMEDARNAVRSVLEKDPTYADAQRLAQSLGL
jgi:tetratricopeptide (TPR) repeat protein